MRIILHTTFHVFAGLLLLSVPMVIYSQMESANYMIDFDSINIGGGEGDSANYNLQDTVGGIGTGFSSSNNFELHAGYQQLGPSSIALIPPVDSALPDLVGLPNQSSQKDMTVGVITNDPSGYELRVRATTDPLLQGPIEDFFDYDPGGAPSFDFTVPSSLAVLGFTVEGVDTVLDFMDNGTACGAGSNITPNTCWDGFTTIDRVIATDNTFTAELGNETILKLRAETGNSAMRAPGAYSGTLIITALTL